MSPDFLVAGRGRRHLGEGGSERTLRAGVPITQGAIAVWLVGFLASCVEGALHLVERCRTVDGAAAAENALGGLIAGIGFP